MSFHRTRNQLATLVLGEMGVLANGQSAGSADQDLIYEAIDLRLKELHKDGILWNKTVKVPLEFSLSAGANSASATSDILFPIKLTIGDLSADNVVEIINPVQYAKLAYKSQLGTPLRALWKGGAEFLFHPVPVVATTAKLVYEKIIDDTSASATVDVDVAMLRSLKDLIKFDVADHWGKPEATIVRWERRALIAEKTIRKVTALRVDYKNIAVDDFDDPVVDTDYGFHR